MSRVMILTACLSIALAGSRIASATTVQAMSLADLTLGAEVIFRGQVEESEAHWEGNLIVTDSIVRVEECLKGECNERETVRQIGGQVGDLVMEVVGTTAIRPGDEVALFVRSNQAQGHLMPVGLCQGVFVLAPDAVRRDLSEVVLWSDDGAPELLVEAIPTEWEALRQAILDQPLPTGSQPSP